MSSIPSILFVCMGNICRSPTAEIIWKSKILQLDRVNNNLPTIDSAGTIADHNGEPPDSRMQIALRKAGYQPFGFSRKIHIEDFDKFDLILAMDKENLSAVMSMARSAGKHDNHCHLFLDYAGMEGIREVPDPYYGGHKGFQKVVQLIESGCDQILDKIQQNEI